jgi:multidrug efflux system outer membrane protein
MTHSKHTWPALVAILLAGCAVGPNYKRPDTETPDAYRAQGNSVAGSVANLGWEDVAKDPVLLDLIHTALANGYDARIAAARVEESRAIAAEIHGQRFPGIGYAANADRGKNALLGNAYTSGGGTTGDGFDGYIGAAWELDLWGRVRRLDEAARNQYLATEDARRGVDLILVSEVASAYYGLLELDEELEVAHRATQSYGESLKLFNRQLEGGVASRLDTASAEAAMAASDAQVPDIEMRIAATENQICVLIGRSPGSIARGAPLAEQPAPPQVPVGLPSELLERRPDVRQAEEQAHAANAGIGVVVGGFLPRIGLSAILGAVSSDLNGITSEKSGLWSVGAGATGPLFQGGGLVGQYDQAKSAWLEAKLRYQQTALSAFADVSNALVTRQKLTEKLQLQQHAVNAYEEAVKLSTERYKAGKASYFEVLQAQQLLFPAEVTLAQTRRDEFTSVVLLYKALGGGWNQGH